MANFVEANAQDQVLNKQTLGGQVEPGTDEQPIYMVGAFKGGEWWSRLPFTAPG